MGKEGCTQTLPLLLWGREVASDRLSAQKKGIKKTAIKIARCKTNAATYGNTHRRKDTLLSPISTNLDIQLCMSFQYFQWKNAETLYWGNSEVEFTLIGVQDAFLNDNPYSQRS